MCANPVTSRLTDQVVLSNRTLVPCTIDLEGQEGPQDVEFDRKRPQLLSPIRASSLHAWHRTSWLHAGTVDGSNKRTSIECHVSCGICNLIVLILGFSLIAMLQATDASRRMEELIIKSAVESSHQSSRRSS